MAILPMDPQTGCKMLSLPPELRNQIYGYVVEDLPEGPEFPLAKVTNKKSLILTCQQIRNEAKQMLLPTYRDFWENTLFTISPSTSKNENFAGIGDFELTHIRHIKMTTSHKTCSGSTLVLNLTQPDPTSKSRFTHWKIKEDGACFCHGMPHPHPRDGEAHLNARFKLMSAEAVAKSEAEEAMSKARQIQDQDSAVARVLFAEAAAKRAEEAKAKKELDLSHLARFELRQLIKRDSGKTRSE